MTQDVALFLDLDNLVIGAKQANLTLNLNLLIEEIERLTDGRIVLLRAYGDARQSQSLQKNLAALGFTFQTAVRLNSFSKNLADMQIVVEAMETLIDGHEYEIYVFISGDRDFTPLVQTLRKRGKRVVGIGVRHTTSPSLVQVCDQFIYYEDILPPETLTIDGVKSLLAEAMRELLAEESRVRASVLNQQMIFVSRGGFSKSSFPESSFRKFLENHPDLVEIEQEDTTIYVRHPGGVAEQTTEHSSTTKRALHERYRTELKKARLRVVPARMRFLILRDLIQLVQHDPSIYWRQMVDSLSERYQSEPIKISKNMINAVMLVARQARILHTQPGKSLAKSTIVLHLDKKRPFQDAIFRCDAVYLQEIINCNEPFEVEEAALALYDSHKYVKHLQQIMKNLDKLVPSD